MKKILLISTLLVSGVSMAQLPVGTTPENRNVVLEEFTGIHCTFCPDGHKLAQQYKDSKPAGDVILVNVHVGGYAVPGTGEPDFRTSFGSALDGQADVAGYPAGTVNRHVFAGMQQGSGTAMSRGDWDDAGDIVLAEQSYVNLAGEATLDLQTGQMSIDVEYYYTGNSPTGTNKLTIAVLMDNVEGPQTGGSTYNPTAILPNGNYNHNHMLRHFVTGQWGNDITPTTMGSTGSINETWTVPTDLNGVDYQLGDLHVVAYIAEGQQEIETGVIVPLTLTNFPYQTEANCTAADPIADLCSGGSETISPTIYVKNEGEQTITAMDITADINGGTPVVTNWTGSIPYGQTATITLDPITFTVMASNDLNVAITTVNGGSDEVAGNNSLTEQFDQAITTSNYVKVLCTTDYYPGETSWEIQDDMGATVASHTYVAGTEDQWGGGGPDATQTHEHTVDLGSAGCYTLIIYDSFGDGMQYTGGTSGLTFGIELEDITGTPTAVTILGSDFTDEEEGDFQSDGSEPGAGIEDADINSGLSVYPNPSDEATNVAIELEEAADVQLEIINAIGQVIYVQSMTGLNAGTHVYGIDLTDFAAGYYTVKATVNGTVKTSKLSVR